MENGIISASTIKNWVRLGIKEGESRLSKGANKRFSSRNIIPVEYFNNKKNRRYLHQILDLTKGFEIKTVIYSLALNLLNKNKFITLYSNGNFDTDKKYLKEVLNSFKHPISRELMSINLPQDESDFLGIIYQSLLKEGCKNINGSYYTPKGIISKALEDLAPGECFLDPCCGSGSFLIAASEKIKNPEKIYGIDKDEIACFIAKINLIIKFPQIDFYPNIFNADCLTDEKAFSDKFDIIATNPPWGAMNCETYKNMYPEVISGESFSYFIVKVSKMLKKGGRSVFVLPQSVLSVAMHRDIRKFILNNYCIEEINLLNKKFSSVLSKVVVLKLTNNNSVKNIKITNACQCFSVSPSVYECDENFNFSILDNQDVVLLKKIYSIRHETLKDSLFALGIVTGNNSKYLSIRAGVGKEKIYTGKEVEEYFLKPAKRYIKYDRNNFQQVASDNIYRAKEKLVYKFISPTPVFAYDDSSALFLNSANILIPNVKDHTPKTVLAYLNSKLFKYIYLKKINDLKMLKSNLLKLPFPRLKKGDCIFLETLADEYLHNKSLNTLNKIDEFVYKSFHLSKEDILYINSSLC
ncbi:N-6 DNA methylase [bacterium]|nr:N-6 DNA methylase [bacterium]